MKARVLTLCGQVPLGSVLCSLAISHVTLTNDQAFPACFSICKTGTGIPTPVLEAHRCYL